LIIGTSKDKDQNLRILKYKFEKIQNEYFVAYDEAVDALKSLDYCARLVKAGAKNAKRKFLKAEKQYKIAEKKLIIAKEEYEKAIEEIQNTEGLDLKEMDSEGNITSYNGYIEQEDVMSLEEYELMIEKMRADSKHISSEMPNYNSGIRHSKIKDEDNIMHQ